MSKKTDFDMKVVGFAVENTKENIKDSLYWLKQDVLKSDKWNDDQKELIVLGIEMSIDQFK